MSNRTLSAGTVAAVVERAFGLFHGLADAVEIVAGRDHGEEQNKNTPERADEDQ